MDMADYSEDIIETSISLVALVLGVYLWLALVSAGFVLLFGGWSTPIGVLMLIWAWVLFRRATRK